MAEFADLHLHSCFSDGVLTPEELFVKAQSKNLAAISITDHDTVEGCRNALTIKSKFNLELVSGIEFSCYEGAKEYHILGYNIDIENDRLNTLLVEMRKRRVVRAQRIIQKLNERNVPLEMDHVLEQSGTAPIARPHIAQAMLKKGYIQSFRDAFFWYLAEGRPAYEPKYQISAASIIDLISELHGVSVLSHPGRNVTQQELYRLIEIGLDGIEVVHPIHDKDMQKYYQSISRQYWLLETGGSDYHGTRDFDEDNFGKFVVPYSIVDSIKVHSSRKNEAFV
jgi:hypothetical protein